MTKIRLITVLGTALSLAVVSRGLAADESPLPSQTGEDSAVYQEKFMKRAIAISEKALTSPGSEPFGAVIVRHGKIVGEGLNQALSKLDVTSHGEVEAIRDANRNLKRLDLSDCEIYTTCEPCPLCVAAIDIACLRKMYYAASRAQAIKALAGLPPDVRFPVNVHQIFADERRPVGDRHIPAEQKLDEESFQVLKAWTLERKATLSK